MSGIYIHIPFCRQSCIYCNFYFKNGLKGSGELIEALLNEIELRFNEKSFVPSTLYFGGGTPSFVETNQIKRLIDKVKLTCQVDDFEELTLEANPDDMTEEKLKAWREMGVTRLSVGVQSFFDEHLQWMNRAHSGEEAKRALTLAQNMGFELSLDIIFGIPNCDDHQLLKNLEIATSFNIQHISCYGLTLEDNTPWKKLILNKSYVSPDDEQSSRQFVLCMAYLTNKNWEHYEISNYAKPGKLAKHNTSYWQNKTYIGIGPSAHSYDGKTRSWNVADINVYVNAIQSKDIPEEVEFLSDVNRFNEYIMTGLRTQWGIDMNELKQFGLSMEEFNVNLQIGLNKKQLEQVGDKIYLSQTGKLYADAIASSLFIA
jgi:oxygen-independent coproporphyrinogen III oxidase